MILRNLGYQMKEKQYREIFNPSCAALELQRWERPISMERESEPAKVYRLWHEHFRVILIPWDQLSPGNRAKWTAFYNDVIQTTRKSAVPK
jgi:hypothetical protein